MEAMKLITDAVIDRRHVMSATINAKPMEEETQMAGKVGKERWG